jgi:3-phenylpropionate/trans-cinnamate dioxygenase ferredoxin component
LLRFSQMQSFNTKSDADDNSPRNRRLITVGRVEDVPLGRCVTVGFSDGNELALYNVNGEFHASTNYCPHKGAPLSEWILRDHTIECDWHGWRFDVRTGECLVGAEDLETYKVLVEDGLIKIEI